MLELVDVGNYTFANCHPTSVEAQVKALGEVGVSVTKIGESRSGKWPLWGLAYGSKDKPVIALTGNNHAEEVVGTLTILKFFEMLLYTPSFSWLTDHFRFVAAPQMNPDGVENNWDWISDPTTRNLMQYSWRDHRDEDVEHGIAIERTPFVRPEPKALVEFYAREAAEQTLFYCTLHSCTSATGPYFLSGNEDLKSMTRAFEFFRKHAKELGIPVRTEDMNGYKNYRKLEDGVYSVPRHIEMKSSFQHSSAQAKTFLLNSLEWMETRGAKISLVSEVPMIIPRAFTEEEITGREAYEIMSQILPRLAGHFEQRARIIEYFKNDGYRYVANPDRFHWEVTRGEKYLAGATERFEKYLAHYKVRPALKVHEAMLNISEPFARFKIACLYLNITDEKFPEHERYLAMRDAAYGEMDSLIGLEDAFTPLDVHMKLQFVLIFAGILSVLEGGH